jgi:hypothetical protein
MKCKRIRVSGNAICLSYEGMGNFRKFLVKNYLKERGLEKSSSEAGGC